MGMSNNRKIVMLGAVLATDVEQALHDYGASGVLVTPSSIPYRSRINFKEADNGEDRMMIVYEADSYREHGTALHQGMHTLAMLGAWGDYERVAAALFRSFEGYILEETPLGHVRLNVSARSYTPSIDLAQSAAEAAADAIAGILGEAMPTRVDLVEAIAGLLTTIGHSR